MSNGTPPTGNYSAQKPVRGALMEYGKAEPALELHFEFNPTTITRSRTVTIKAGEAEGTQGGYDFSSRDEAVRAAQKATVNAETLSVKILLDATDRLNAGDPAAGQHGIQPEIDTLRSMLEPKIQSGEGARTLAALGAGGTKASSKHAYASVLLFKWGAQVLPVFLTQVQVEIKDYLPGLVPYRAEATLNLQIIESRNDFYLEELQRQFDSAQRFVMSSKDATGLSTG